MTVLRRSEWLLAATVLVLAGRFCELAALKAAGFTGTMPIGGKALQGLVNTLQSNWEWLIALGVGLALTIVAGLMIFGSQRAPDHIFRIIAGILLILVVIPAVLA